MSQIAKRFLKHGVKLVNLYHDEYVASLPPETQTATDPASQAVASLDTSTTENPSSKSLADLKDAVDLLKEVVNEL